VGARVQVEGSTGGQQWTSPAERAHKAHTTCSNQQRRGAWRRLRGRSDSMSARTSEAADGQWVGGRPSTASGRAGNCNDAPGDWDRHAAGVKIFAAGSGWGSARRGGSGGCGGRAGANTYPVKEAHCTVRDGLETAAEAGGRCSGRRRARVRCGRGWMWLWMSWSVASAVLGCRRRLEAGYS
jgi:hypothetical protein